MKLSCKRCGSTSFVKHGFVRGLQRYRGKTCGFHFTATPKRGRSEATKALEVLLYSFGKASFRWLGRLFKVSAVSAYKWYARQSRHCRSRKSGKKSGRWNWMNCGIFFMQKKQALDLESL